MLNLMHTEVNKMKFNYCKLKGRIIEKFGSQSAFAKEFGNSENSLSRKMNNKIRFSADDMIRASKLLDIPENEIGLYFFTEKV